MAIYQSTYKCLGRGRSIFYAWFEVMHTRADLLLCHRPERELNSIVDLIVKELLRIENIANRFDRNSELGQLNDSAFLSPIKVSEELFSIIRCCIESYDKTLGYFDITVNSANNYRDGIKNIILDPQSLTVHFLHPDIKIDLCGFVKGYALDRVKQLLQNNVSDALLNLGNSSVMALGNHPCGDGWKIAMNAQTYSSIKHPIILHNECFTSSGNSSENFNHIICPETGKRVERKEVVSLITPDGVDGEIFSTALFAAPQPDREKMIRKFALKIIS